MKNLFALIIVLSLGTIVKAQNPISWTFSSQKIADNTYEVQLTATIQAGWHLYSQQQPDDAIAIPTEIKITKNPLFALEGPIKEKGKMEKFHDAKLDVSANQYSNKVVFIQTVKVKASAKTNVTGTVEFQTCNDEKCLPPKTVTFSVAIK